MFQKYKKDVKGYAFVKHPGILYDWFYLLTWDG